MIFEDALQLVYCCGNQFWVLFFETAFSFSFLQVQRPLSLRMNWHELAKASTHFLMSLLRK